MLIVVVVVEVAVVADLVVKVGVVVEKEQIS